MSMQIIHIKNCEKYCTLAEFIRGILKKIHDVKLQNDIRSVNGSFKIFLRTISIP